MVLPRPGADWSGQGGGGDFWNGEFSLLMKRVVC